PRHHDMAEPGREAMAGIVALGTQFGRGAERIADPLCRALVVRRKRDTDMAVVQYRVVLAISLADLIETLGNQIGADSIAGHERQRRLEKVQAAERRKLVEHHQQLMLAA